MRIKRYVLVSAAVLAAGAGGGAAIAASGSDERQQAEQSILDDAAKRLDVTPEALRSALGAAEDAQIDQAVKDGKLTQQQADAIKARRQQDGRVLGGPGGFRPGGPGGPGPGRPGPGGPLHRGAVLDAAASALGLKPADLREQLRDGKSLAAVAKAKGKDVADVKAAIKAAITKQLDQAVADKKLTADQRDRVLSGLDARLDDLVQRSGQRGAPGPGRPPALPGHGAGPPRHWR